MPSRVRSPATQQAPGPLLTPCTSMRKHLIEEVKALRKSRSAPHEMSQDSRRTAASRAGQRDRLPPHHARIEIGGPPEHPAQCSMAKLLPVGMRTSHTAVAEEEASGTRAGEPQAKWPVSHSAACRRWMSSYRLGRIRRCMGIHI